MQRAFTFASPFSWIFALTVTSALACRDRNVDVAPASASSTSVPTASTARASVSSAQVHDAASAPCREWSPPDIPAISVPAVDQAPVAIDHPERLHSFFDAVRAQALGRRNDHVRIAYYGDSNGTKDHLTGELRRTLQTMHSDAGHGIIALGRPWSWYIHHDIRVGSNSGFTGHAVSTNWVADPYYGHGLIVGEAKQLGARTWVATAEAPSTIGRRITRAEIAYLRCPDCGPFRVEVDGVTKERVESSSPRYEAGYVRLSLEDAPHRIEVVTESKLRVRLLGAFLERFEKPSFVIDAISVGGVSFRTVLRDDEALFQSTLRHRAYDLIVIQMGTNTWVGEENVPKPRDKTTREVLRRLKQSGAPVLMVSPPDHKYDTDLIATVVREQAAIAKEEGASFYNMHRAMGGKGVMTRYFMNGLAQSDLVHWNEAGGAYLGRGLLRSLWSSLRAYAEEHRLCPR